MRENANQNNSEYGHLLRRVYYCQTYKEIKDLINETCQGSNKWRILYIYIKNNELKNFLNEHLSSDINFFEPEQKNQLLYVFSSIGNIKTL